MKFSSIALLDCLNQDLNAHDHETFHPCYHRDRWNESGFEIQEFAIDTLRRSFFKKFKDDADSETCNQRALELFVSYNNKCEDWAVPSAFGAGLYRLFKKRLTELLRTEVLDWDLASIMKHGGWGPGASVGADGYDFYTKFFSSSLTMTSPGMYTAYKTYCETLPLWNAAEQARHLQRGLDSVKYVPGSNLSFVPKNNTISRVICTEPALNMFVQKALGNVIESRINRVYGISLKTQSDINKRMAMEGSRGGDNPYCTIDLKSASDTISLGLIVDAVPEPLKGLLLASRSPATKLPDGSWLSLNMISSMGNGFTFPLQTAIFICAVHACYDYLNVPIYSGRGKSRKLTFGVFGDDIVVLQNTYDVVAALLEQLGFTVNMDKSYNTGLFRESCGGDFYNGVNVRGVYIKSLASQASRYVAINRLISWSATHNVALTRTISYLRDWCSAQKSGIHFVPMHANSDCGVRIPSFFFDKKSVLPQGNYAYRCLTPKKRTLRIGEGKVSWPKNERPRDYNPDGLLVAFLGGYVRYGEITLRSVDSPLYRTDRRITSAWDLLHDDLVDELNVTMDPLDGRCVTLKAPYDSRRFSEFIWRRVSRLVNVSYLLVE